VATRSVCDVSERQGEDRVIVVIREWSARQVLESIVRSLCPSAAHPVSSGESPQDCSMDWLLPALEPIVCPSGTLSSNKIVRSLE